MRSADNNIFLGQSFRRLLSALLEGICTIGAVLLHRLLGLQRLTRTCRGGLTVTPVESGAEADISLKVQLIVTEAKATSRRA